MKWDSQKNLSLRKLDNSTWHLLAAVAAADNNTPGDAVIKSQFWRHQMSCMFLMASLLKYNISAQWILSLYLYSIIKRISFSFPKIVCWFSIFDIFLLLLLHILFVAIFVPVFFLFLSVSRLYIILYKNNSVYWEFFSTISTFWYFTNVYWHLFGINSPLSRLRYWSICERISRLSDSILVTSAFILIIIEAN